MSKIFDLSGLRVWVPGHRGMVGSAVVRALATRGVAAIRVDSSQLDLRDQADVRRFMREESPEVVIVAAAKVGGIHANSTYPADFIYDNLTIAANIIHASWESRVKKLLYLGSTCIYPRNAEQPIREESLLTGALEPTNQWYAVAKIAGLKLCEAYRAQHGRDFISAMPTNLYGPNDNFDLQTSHVLPALMRKIHEAKANRETSITLWGSGTPRREFMHVDDLASALIHLLEYYSDAQHINVGTGVDCTIGELALLIANAVGYAGGFTFDRSKPDGPPRKCTNISRLKALGFVPQIPLEQGIRDTYAWFVENGSSARGMS